MMGIYSSTLDFAIEREELLHRYYTLLARRAKTEEMRVVLTNFAQEVLQLTAAITRLLERSGDLTRIVFENVKLNPSIAPDLFEKPASP